MYREMEGEGCDGGRELRGDVRVTEKCKVIMEYRMGVFCRGRDVGHLFRKTIGGGIMVRGVLCRFGGLG